MQENADRGGMGTRQDGHNIEFHNLSGNSLGTFYISRIFFSLGLSIQVMQEAGNR